MRILFLNSKNSNAPGGAERFSKVVMDALGPRNIYKEIYEIKDQSFDENCKIRSKYIKKYKNTIFNRINIVFSSLLTSKKKLLTNREIDNFKPDIVIVNNGIVSGCSYISKKNLKRIPTYVIQHTDIKQTIGSNFFLKKIFFKLTTLNSKYIKWVAFSEESLRISKQHFKYNQGYVLPLFSEKKAYNPIRKNDVIFVGRMSHEKNIPFLNKVLENLPDLNKIVIGQGEEIKQLNLEMPKLQHIKWMTNEDVNKEIGNSKLLFLCSLYEGFSYVSVEAINNNTPILIKNNFLEAKTLVGSNYARGSLYEGDDPLDISNKIRSMLDMYQDKEYIDKILNFHDFSTKYCKNKMRKIFTNNKNK